MKTTSLVFCFLLSALCFEAAAQYSIDWYTVDGGGGTSTGDVFSVTGTIGQPGCGHHDIDRRPVLSNRWILGGLCCANARCPASFHLSHDHEHGSRVLAFAFDGLGA